jgi:uncharacterized protein YerC
MDDNLKIQELIKENTHLFWWVPEDKKKNLSLDSLVEAILNYGNSESVRKLFDYCGIKKVAEIFYKQTAGQRTNYLKQTKHYFSLYFKKYA